MSNGRRNALKDRNSSCKGDISTERHLKEFEKANERVFNCAANVDPSCAAGVSAVCNCFASGAGGRWELGSLSQCGFDIHSGKELEQYASTQEAIAFSEKGKRRLA